MNNTEDVLKAIIDVGLFIGDGLIFWYYCRLSKKSFKDNIKMAIFFGILWFLSALVILLHAMNYINA